MKTLLAAVNAKYIHSNLAIYSLKANSGIYESQVRLMEYSINQYPEEILQSLYKEGADRICFSCYIWNIQLVEQVARQMKLIAPDISLWLGGPEVSFDVFERLEKWPFIDGIMYGEGEDTFRELMAFWNGKMDLEVIRGIGHRTPEGGIHIHPARDFVNLSGLNFVYTRPQDFNNKIVYYETSRGCPYQCSYCLSSVEKAVRFRDERLVKQDLQQFIDWEIPQVKFVDRTFNCRHEHFMEILRFIQKVDRGKTNFHFEITADLLSDEEIKLMKELRPGLIQLEIGVQSTNPETLKEIRRQVSFEKLSEIVGHIHEGKNIHLHLDLIAGLPFENLARFIRSFNDVYALKPEQLQLGFLKVLKGSHMREKAEDYGLVYNPWPPYEVLRTHWLSYDDILVLKGVEEMVEVYYNSRQFENSMEWLEHFFPTAFDMYRSLSEFYETEGIRGISHSRMARYEILLDFAKSHIDKENSILFTQIMTYDLYLRENVKSRPDWTAKQDCLKEVYVNFFRDEKSRTEYFSGYEEYTTKQIQRMTHIEHFDMDIPATAAAGQPVGKPMFLWFDYQHRDPLTWRSRTTEVKINEIDEETACGKNT